MGASGSQGARPTGSKVECLIFVTSIYQKPCHLIGDVFTDRPRGLRYSPVCHLLALRVTTGLPGRQRYGEKFAALIGRNGIQLFPMLVENFA
ncbi:hypothetical protein GCM10027287_05620 [Bordetella muralis]